MKTILLFGKNGQIGWELQRSLAPLGRIISVGRGECDLTMPDQVQAVVRHYQPEIIVNAAAYTAVDKAETDIDAARTVNAIVPGVLATEAKKLSAWLVHYSTDYVFDGSKQGSYVEDDATQPLSIYGTTKLEGEQAIKQSDCHYFIFRTSWVFAARGNNFAKTILRLAKDRDTLKIIADQHGAPTSAELIADITSICLRDVLQPGGETKQGLYHLAAAGETTWHGFASFVLEQAEKSGKAIKCKAANVAEIPTSDYPLPAQRPSNSRLNTLKLQQTFNLNLPEWHYHAERMLTEIFAKD